MFEVLALLIVILHFVLKHLDGSSLVLDLLFETLHQQLQPIDELVLFKLFLGQVPEFSETELIQRHVCGI